MIKNSIYNHIVSLDNNEFAIYNTRTMGLSILDKDSYINYNKLSNSEQIQNKSFVKELYEGGFFVNDDVNEVDFIKTNMLRSRYIVTAK